VDPHASSSELQHEYGIGLTTVLRHDYDAIIVAVNHDEFATFNEAYFKTLLKDGKGILVDVKGTYRNKIQDLTYWSL
jgi:UDP-N-acetyl-D-galactosamine dehydrogenase